MNKFEKITEQPSKYRHLDKMSIGEILVNINEEDKTVAQAVEKTIPQVKRLVGAISDKMLAGGRLFYIGAGTSGRLAVVDASECPPTYGVPYGLVIAIIAGGDEAITKAIENAEDDLTQGWEDLKNFKVTTKDVVVGIAASGTTPYVIGEFFSYAPSLGLSGCFCRAVCGDFCARLGVRPVSRILPIPCGRAFLGLGRVMSCRSIA